MEAANQASQTIWYEQFVFLEIWNEETLLLLAPNWACVTGCIVNELNKLIKKIDTQSQRMKTNWAEKNICLA